MMDSFLETLLGLSEFSSLVVPLGSEDALPLFETVALTSSLRKDRVSMYNLCQDLTIGWAANVVSGSTSLGSLALDFPANKVRAKTGLLRGTDAPEYWETHFKESRLLEYGTDERMLHKYYVPQSWKGEDYLYAELTLDDSISGVRKLVGSNHDLKSRVLDFTQEYVWGYESDSEFD